MKKILAVIIFMILSVGFVGAYDPVLPLKMNTTTKQVVDQHNIPIFIQGDAPWFMAIKLTEANVIKYLDDRKAKGFNAIIIDIIEDDDTGPNNVYGEAPFSTPGNFSTANTDYFDHVDFIITEAGKRGIIVFAFPAYLGSTDDNGWRNELTVDDIENIETYGTFLGNRYKDFTNIVWVMGGDNDVGVLEESYPTLTAKHTALANAIKAADTNHLMTAHSSDSYMSSSPYYSRNSALADYNEAWLDFNSSYWGDYNAPRECKMIATAIKGEYDYIATMPFVDLEGTYESAPTGFSDSCITNQVYVPILGGAFGHFMGNYLIFPFATGWETALGDYYSTTMKYAGNLMRSRRWNLLVPDYTHTTVTAGYGAIDTATYVASARASDGSSIIAYLPDASLGTGISVNMARITDSGGKANAWWYDPSSGIGTLISEYNTSGVISFRNTATNSAGNKNWVLVIDSKAAAFSKPGSGNNPLKVSTTNPRYMEDHNGDLVYLTGSHTWGTLYDIGTSRTNLVAFDYVAWLDFLESYNHNFFRLWRWPLTHWQADPTKASCTAGVNCTRYAGPYQPWARSATTGALDGGNKFNLSTFDENYFNRLRSRVLLAQARGIYVGVMLFEGNSISWSSATSGGLPVVNTTSRPNAVYGHPMNSSNNTNSINANTFLLTGAAGVDNFVTEVNTKLSTSIYNLQLAYAKKVLDTLYDLDNVIYEVGNEMGSYSNTFQEDIITALKAYQTAQGYPAQLIGRTAYYHQTSTYLGTNAPLWTSGADWVSPRDQTGDIWSIPQINTGTKVVLLDTDHIGGITTSTTKAWVWESFTMGHNPIYMDGYNSMTAPGGPWMYSVPTNGESIRKAMGHTKTYADKIDLKNMTPQPTLSTTGYALAYVGNEYLIYQPTVGSFTVTLPAKTYYYEWFNPSSTTVTVTPSETGTIITSGTSHVFTQPSSILADAVLYLKVIGSVPSGDCSKEAIQALVNSAARGSIVTVPAGNCTWAEPLIINKAITLIGEGSTLDGCSTIPPTSTCITSGFKTVAKFPIDQITKTGTTAYVTQTAHGMKTDDHVYIQGADQTEYNGDKKIVRTGTNTYTFTVSGSPDSPATGTITAGYRRGTHLIDISLSLDDVSYLTRTSNMYIDLESWAMGHRTSSFNLSTGLNNWITKYRLDNMHFVNIGSRFKDPKAGAISRYGWITGVVDNNTFDFRGIYEGLTSDAFSSTWDTCSIGATDTACDSGFSNWADWDNGTDVNIFFEDNKFICNTYEQEIVIAQGMGGVIRYNEFDYSGTSGYFYAMDTHGHQRDWVRSAFGAEVYGNLVKGYTSTTLNQSNNLGSFRGSRHKIFYNKYTGNISSSGYGVQNFYPVTFLTNTNPDGNKTPFPCLANSLYEGVYACSYTGLNQNPSHTYGWNNRNSRDSNTLMTVTINRGANCRAPWSDYCQLGVAGVITSITRISTTATVNQTAHGLQSGNTVIIRGANQTEYNGTKTIVRTGDNTYTYTVSGTPDTPATGTLMFTNLNNCYGASAGTYPGGTVTETISGVCGTYPSPLDYDIRWLRVDRDASCANPDESACEAPHYEFWFDAANWNRVVNTTTQRSWAHNGDSAYDGTVGIGCGTLAARPATCTHGTAYWVPDSSMYAGGALDPCGTVPLGSYGTKPTVPIKGTLYICGSSNWTNATTYTPFEYPHPLRDPNPSSDTTTPAYVEGTASPPATPAIDCTPPTASVPLTFKVAETQTGPVTCLGCTEGVDGCTSASTYDQINAMASKITYTSTQSGTIYTQTATKTSNCSTNYKIWNRCKDSATPSNNKMTTSVLIDYSTTSVSTDAPYLLSATLQEDGRTIIIVFNEPVTLITTDNTAGKNFGWDYGDYGPIYFKGSGTTTLYFQVADCIPAGAAITMQYGQDGDDIQNLAGVDFPSMDAPLTVTNNSTQTTCGSTVSLFNHTDTPAYNLYTQGGGGPTILGTRFELDILPAILSQVCFYKDATMDGEEHTAFVFGPSGSNPNALLSQEVFASETESGYQCQTLSTPVFFNIDVPYTVAVKFPLTWLKSEDYFATTFVNGNDYITVDAGNGRWVDSTQVVYPSHSTTSNFGVDFVLTYQSATGPWKVTITKTGSGCSVSPSETQIIADEATASATVTLNTGYTATWSDTCGGGTVDGSTYTVTSVEADCGISLTCSTIVRPPWIYIAP